VTFVLGALCHPAADRIFLRGSQFLVRECRRHDARVLGKDALDDSAVFRIARDDGDHVGLACFDGLVTDVEPESRHTRILVRAMAPETRVRHDRTNVAIEADGALAGNGYREQGEKIPHN